MVSNLLTGRAEVGGGGDGGDEKKKKNNRKWKNITSLNWAGLLPAAPTMTYSTGAQMTLISKWQSNNVPHCPSLSAAASSSSSNETVRPRVEQGMQYVRIRGAITTTCEEICFIGVLTCGQMSCSINSSHGNTKLKFMCSSTGTGTVFCDAVRVNYGGVTSWLNEWVWMKWNASMGRCQFILI